MLIPFALIFEGAPPIPTGPQAIGFAYVTVIATALAYVVWFTGLQHLPASTIGAIGLLNPLCGVMLGVSIAHEGFGVPQLVGIILVVAGVAISLQTPKPASPSAQTAQTN